MMLVAVQSSLPIIRSGSQVFAPSRLQELGPPRNRSLRIAGYHLSSFAEGVGIAGFSVDPSILTIASGFDWHQSRLDTSPIWHGFGVGIPRWTHGPSLASTWLAYTVYCQLGLTPASLATVREWTGLVLLL